MIDVRIQSVGFEVRESLKGFIQTKANKLERFYDNIQKVEVSLKLKPDPADNKEASIRIHVPGTELYANKVCDSFEEAVDVVLDALTKQLIKYKEKVAAK